MPRPSVIINVDLDTRRFLKNSTADGVYFMNSKGEVLMKHGERKMLFYFLAPAVLLYLLIYCYPTIKTVYMTFYNIPGIASSRDRWTFVGIQNYIDIFNNPLFRISYSNILKIMFIGGVATFIIAFIFACVLTKGMKFSSFWKSVIYLPNIITPVALVVMWTQYAFNNRYGFFKTFFDFLGLHKLADIPWTSPQLSFAAMTIAYCFGSVGYYMIMFMAAMEKIPNDYYECAHLEGANGLHTFFKITLPLMKDITKTCCIFWCLGCINFFLWSKVFSITPDDPNTLAPAALMYRYLFGSSTNNVMISGQNVGLGTTIGVILCISTVLIFAIFNIVFGKEKYEY